MSLLPKKKFTFREVVGLLVVSCALIAVIGYAAGVPHIFTSGTTAKAGEVNANFDYVNYGNIIVKDGNGVEIGTATGAGYGISVLNNEGYLFNIVGDGISTPEYIEYESTDCTGTGYIWVGLGVQRGTVYRSGTALKYIPKDATVQSITFNSYLLESGVCSTGTAPDEAFPLSDNDPEVTGVSSYTFTPPVTVERR